jgi:hypothetical protein
MPLSPDPRRRTAIWALAAFAAGALGTVGILQLGPARPVTQPVAAAGHALPAAGSTAHAVRETGTHPAAASSMTAVTDPAAEPDADAPTLLDDSAWPGDAPTPEQVFAAQPAQMKASLSRLARRTLGETNVYAIAFAGDGSESVFRNEAEYLDRLMTTRFGSPGHTLVLENHPATLSSHPLASWTNLEAALNGLASVMDPREDVLLLYIATHGGSDHSLLVDMDPIPLDQLDADGLADIFASHPFRWKVLVVNACYSGGFVPKLRGRPHVVRLRQRFGHHVLRARLARRRHQCHARFHRRLRQGQGRDRRLGDQGFARAVGAADRYRRGYPGQTRRMAQGDAGRPGGSVRACEIRRVPANADTRSGNADATPW